MTSFVSKSVLRTGIAALAVIFSAIPAFAGGSYSVDLNKTEIVRLPESAGAVVIGNPQIADVTVHSANTLFVVGRGYGETNLIVLNASGHTIMNADIQVTHKQSTHGVRLFNGKERESYNCMPYCLPSPILGDAAEFIQGNSGQAQDIDNRSSTASPTSGNSFAGSSSSSASAAQSSSNGNSDASYGSSTNF